MLHPALSRALATAHIEDLHRAAAQRHTIRLARRVAHERFEWLGSRSQDDSAGVEFLASRASWRTFLLRRSTL